MGGKGERKAHWPNPQMDLMYASYRATLNFTVHKKLKTKKNRPSKKCYFIFFPEQMK